MGSDIEIVYHVATINCFEELIQKQLTLLKACGLWEACDRLTIVVVGTEFDSVKKIIQESGYSHKSRAIYGGDLRFCEFPSIAMVKQIAKEREHARIFYFHTKGVSKTLFLEQFLCDSWRRYMEYFNIERWRDCLAALQDVDACGVEWSRLRNGWGFAGNFWWARAEYLRSCRGIENHPKDSKEAFLSRGLCESFIGTGNQGGRLRIFFHSRRNLLHQPIDAKEYLAVQ